MFSDGMLTRDEAAAMSHGDAIERATGGIGGGGGADRAALGRPATSAAGAAAAARRRRYDATFDAFAAAWNEAFSLVEHLKEC